MTHNAYATLSRWHTSLQDCRTLRHVLLSIYLLFAARRITLTQVHHRKKPPFAWLELEMQRGRVPATLLAYGARSTEYIACYFRTSSHVIGNATPAWEVSVNSWKLYYCRATEFTEYGVRDSLLKVLLCRWAKVKADGSHSYPCAHIQFSSLPLFFFFLLTTGKQKAAETEIDRQQISKRSHCGSAAYMACGNGCLQ